MPADQETITAIQSLADRIEAKMERATEKGEEQARRLYSRMDEQSITTNKAITDFGLKLENVATTLRAHVADDDRRFSAVDRDTAEAKTERVSMWKVLGSSAVGGGVIASLIQALTGKGPS